MGLKYIIHSEVQYWDRTHTYWTLSVIQKTNEAENYEVRWEPPAYGPNNNQKDMMIVMYNVPGHHESQHLPAWFAMI